MEEDHVIGEENDGDEEMTIITEEHVYETEEEGEEEEEGIGKPDTKKGWGYDGQQSKGIVGTVFKTKSPILKISDTGFQISYYEIKGRNVVKKEVATSLTASGGSEDMLSLENQTRSAVPPYLQAIHNTYPPQFQGTVYGYNRDSGKELIAFMDENFKQSAEGKYEWLNGETRIPLKLLDNVLNSAIYVLGKESLLVDVKSEGSTVCIFGDVHGSYRDLRRFIDLLDVHNPENKVKLVFLGDYVDRGTNPVESFAYLLALKVLYPDRVILLMGNHEYSNTCRENYYFTFKEAVTLFYESYTSIWKNFKIAICFLPLAAIIDDKVYCAHGGIPRFYNSGNLDSLFRCMRSSSNIIDFIQRKENPHIQFEFFDIISSDPLGNDFEIPQQKFFPPNFYVTPRIRIEELTDEGKKNLNLYPCGFKKEAVNDFFKITNTEYIVRAHQHSEGYLSLRYGAKLFTVFTSTELIRVNDAYVANILAWNGTNFKVIALSNAEAKKNTC